MFNGSLGNGRQIHLCIDDHYRCSIAQYHKSHARTSPQGGRGGGLVNMDTIPEPEKESETSNDTADGIITFQCARTTMCTLVSVKVVHYVW